MFTPKIWGFIHDPIWLAQIFSDGLKLNHQLAIVASKCFEPSLLFFFWRYEYSKWWDPLTDRHSSVFRGNLWRYMYVYIYNICYTYVLHWVDWLACVPETRICKPAWLFSFGSQAVTWHGQWIETVVNVNHWPCLAAGLGPPMVTTSPSPPLGETSSKWKW